MAAIQMAVLLMVAGGPTAYVFNQTISADTQNYNLRSAALAAGWNGTDPLQATVTINSGVYVGATGTGFYGFDTGASFPAGTTLAVINNGFIVGAGGAGGNAGAGGAPLAGSPGGPAFRAQAAVTVTNNGTIGGGGGGGGHGGPESYSGVIDDDWGGGGGGGRGFVGGAAGIGGGVYDLNGTAGSKTAPGTGGPGGMEGSGGGGNGGDLGAAGVAGKSGGNYYAGGAGGAAGAAVVGNANITWAATGTRLGSIS